MQWGEIANHPGLITAFQQISNNPVVIMVNPEAVMVQEIRVGSKSKVVDSVAIRQGNSSNQHPQHQQQQEPKTTMILLCEDGSLKVYVGGDESTNLWISKRMLPIASMMALKPPRRKKYQKAVGNSARPSANVMFPVDFFESCSPIGDVEFGGDDLLQVYNVQQIKARLHTSGMYIASTKPAGFTLEVTNKDANQVMVGVRVHLGSQDATRVPSYVEVFGRSVSTTVTRGRWFDIPLARDESLQADKRLTIVFGPSLDPGGVCLVDSVQIYGKTKDAFAWPDDDDASGGGADQAGGASGAGAHDQDGTDPGASALAPVERLVAGMLDMIEGYFRMSAVAPPAPDAASRLKSMATSVMSDLIKVPASRSIEKCCKSILSLLFPTKQAYYLFKDQIILKHVTGDLDKYDAEARTVGVENFHRLVLTCRAVALSRPQNLVKYAETKQVESAGAVAKGEPSKTRASEERQSFLTRLSKWFWQLLSSQPVNTLAGTLGQPGITHVEATVQAIVEVLHAFTAVDHDLVPFTARIYADFLTADNTQVCFAAKQALIRALRPKVRRRRVVIPSPPRRTSPIPIPAPQQQQQQQQQQQMMPSAPRRAGHPNANLNQGEFPDIFRAPGHEQQDQGGGRGAAINVGPGGIPLGGIAGNLDALVMPAGADDEPGAVPPNLPNVLDALAGDVDDEAMVELAIALSLQEQQGDQPMPDNLQQGLLGLQEGLEQLVNLGQDLQHLPALQGLAGMLGGAMDNEDDNDADEPEMPPQIEGEVAPPPPPPAAEAPEEPMDENAAAVQGAVVVGQGGADGSSNQYSDASAPASDDEGSNAAMDGSALRTPPAEQDQGSAAGSESGASVVESIGVEHSVSGRSSAYEGDGSGKASGSAAASVKAAPGGGGAAASALAEEESEFESTNAKLHALRLLILDQLLSYTPRLRDVGGVRCIPFMQVLLMLTTDLDANEDKDKAVLDKLLTTLIAELSVDSTAGRSEGLHSDDGEEFYRVSNCCSVRSNLREMQLVIMRLLNVLLSRSKSWQGKQISAPTSSTSSADSNFVSHATAKALVKSRCVDHNLEILTNLLGYWKNKVIEDNSAKVGSGMLRAQPLRSPPDMSPFFLKKYVMGQAHDVFEPYPQLLTEMALRLPYQVRKISEGLSEKVHFSSSWYYFLCEYMMTRQTDTVRRQVRKLLLYICGTKEKYRELRDLHSLGSHVKSIRAIVAEAGVVLGGEEASEAKAGVNLPYDSLLQLIEHLKACVDIATSRTPNWQKYCLQGWQKYLEFMFYCRLIAR